MTHEAKAVLVQHGEVVAYEAVEQREIDLVVGQRHQERAYYL